MARYDMLDDLSIDLSLAGELGFNPFYPQTEARSAGKVLIDGNWYIDLASNDYLGLATDGRLREVYGDAIARFGVSLCGTPIAAGGNTTTAEMEERIAAFMGCEAAMAFPSCYQANTSLFSSILAKDDLAIIDHFAHASLIEGVKASGCRIMPFVHNSGDHLEKLLGKPRPFRRTVVVTESVFSTEGSIAPFERIAALCDRYGALPVVDDSHGIGVIGRNGAGILDHSGIVDYNGICTASLGKALANSGGIIAAKKKVIEGLKYRCPGMMYSTAIPPAVAGGITHVLDRLEIDFGRLQQRLLENRLFLAAACARSGLRLQGGEAPIISILCGTTRETIRFAKRLFERGIVATPFVEPSVPPNRGVVRMIPGAGISADDCRGAAASIETIAS
ncbi:MAG: pyridoxal phosphate-dependent aminotransferase family protein [Chitinispirillaceae bacterium]|nr:pyridoxal phosphate-dependent aminotransferase family protein [Chitinispirillaceae bacterium]